MMQNLSANAIRKPIPPIILFVLLTFAGLLGFSRLGINQFPDVDIPWVTVSVSQPGAAPAVDPVHAVQPLEHGDAALAGAQQPGQLARAADDEHSIVGLVVQVVGDADAAARQPVRQPALKARRPGDAGDAGDQAQAV